MKKLCLLLAGFTLLCGTAAAQRENVRVYENFWYNSTAARNLEPRHEIVVTPLLADVAVQKEEVETLVDGKTVRKEVFRKADFEKDYYVDIDYSRANRELFINELKKQALFDCSKEYGADLIVGALISTQTVDDDRNGATDRSGNRFVVRINIIGYPANYVDFRPADQSDYWIKNMLLNKDEKREEQKNSAVTGSDPSSVVTGRKTTVVAN